MNVTNRENLATLKSQVERLKQLDRQMSLFGASTLWRQRKRWPPGTTEETISERLKKANISEQLLTLEHWIEIELFDFRRYCQSKDIGHQYQFNPCLNESDITRFEQQFGVKLPEEYRDFLLIVGNGGAGPDYGILSLEQSLEEIAGYIDPDEGDPPLSEFLARPFVPPTYLEGSEDDDSDGFDSYLTGMLPICEVGCGHNYQLCLSGIERGNIWFWNTNTGRYYPTTSRNRSDSKKALTFFQWYQEWLYHSLIQYSGSHLSALLAPDLIDPKQYQHLSFSTAQLKEVPPEIVAFSGLESLDLSENQLETLPDELAKLPQLRTLTLTDNKFTAIPDVVYQMPSLEYLNICGNCLKAIDSRIEQLGCLRELALIDNQLETLPDEIGQLGRLEKLSLAGNQIKSLPPSIGRLTGLKELFMYENRLTSLPKEIGNLENLTYLELSDNPLTELPKEISQLKKLERLGLDSKVSSLPSALAKLIT
jgi:hypothetical protein